MSSQPHLGVAALLSAFLGPLGVDKFYVGATGLGILQLLLTLTIIGMFVSIPWAYISTIVLLIAILWGGAPALYPKVVWAPVTSTDKTIAWIAVVLAVLSVAVGIVMGSYAGKKSEPFNKVCKNCKKSGGCKCK